MASSLDRSTREAQRKKKEARDEQKKEKDRKKEYQTRTKERQRERKSFKRVSAAHYETRSVIRTMILSAGVLLIAFLVFEIALLVWKNWLLPADADFTREDTYWHLINIADTCIGFVIGLTAMDALNYYNGNQKSRREEQRAIIRHNRIVKPCIDMYLARKNSLITPSGQEVQIFKVVTNASVRDLKDMYDASTINSDAGKSKIEAYWYYLKKLNTAFLNMAEDINFDYNPEICDAMMKFLNETTYGIAAAEAVVSFGKEGNRTQKMSVIRKIKEVPEGTEIADVEGELNTVFIFMHMIHAHEDALKSYLTVIEEIDNETQVRRKKLL